VLGVILSVLHLLAMDYQTISATGETSNEATIDGGKKSQVRRMSKLPVQIGKTGVLRQPFADRGLHKGPLKNQVYLPAESCVHLESSEGKENKQGQVAKSQGIQHRYIT